MNKSEKNKLNKVNMRLLLEALDPKRKDIVVTRTGDSQNIIWRATNNQGLEIFSLQNKAVKYEDSFYGGYERIFTLKINNISIVSDQDYDTEAFIKNKLQSALEAKIYAQTEEERMQKAAKNMSRQDIIIKKYLEQMLQR